MIAHTPAPWAAHETETRTSIKAGRRVVAYVQIGAEQDDNAALIAAAPELVSALQAMVNVFGTLIDFDAGKIAVDKARSALKKAGSR